MQIHVKGAAYFGNENGDSYYRVSIGGSGSSYGSVGYGYLYSSGNNEYKYALNDYASQLRFDVGGFVFFTAPVGSTGQTVAFQRAMTINNNGNVSIGTTSFNTYKLAVEGTIGAREVNVNLNTWPDYVFTPEYKLPSLEQVQKYIKENHHLPEVPSENEVKENGVNVGEMNAILLKKIEELTLYMIELKEKNEALEKRTDQLSKMIESYNNTNNKN